MSVLMLSSAIADQIERDGVAAYPNECCGIMIGRDTGDERIVEKLVPMKNVFDPGEQYHRFSIDPMDVAPAKAMRMVTWLVSRGHDPLTWPAMSCGVMA